MQKKIYTLTLSDFARLFGTKVGDIPKECRSLMARSDFRYRAVTSAERDRVILEILKKLETGNFSIAGRQKIGLWKKGWGDIRDRFVKSGYDVNTLFPHYDLKPGEVLRLDREFIIPKDPMFEMKWLEIFRTWFFKKYLSSVDSIYEFGCGTGRNLVALAKLFPEKKLYGFEWVRPSVDIINLLARKHQYNIEGGLFDFFSPDYRVRFSPNSAILTRAALEQVGSNFDKFLNFLLKRSPSLCVHIEPIVELYDDANLIDHLAVVFQRKRNYLDGYLDRLRELERRGVIDILAVHRVPFGSLHLDPYSYIVWVPKVLKAKK